MQVKYIFALFLFFLNCTNSYSQENLEHVIIYLNGDGYIRGTLAESSDPAYTEIVLYDHSAIRLLNFSIKKIKKANPKRTHFSNGKSLKTKGYYGNVSGGWFNARHKYAELPEMEWGLGLQTKHGYHFNQYFGLGGGIGITYFADYAFIPVFLNLRSSPFKKSFTPYVNLDIGYSFSPEKDIDGIDKKGGLMIHPAIGIQFPSKHAVNFFMELGMKFQKARQIENFWREEIYNLTFRRTSLVVGIAF